MNSVNIVGRLTRDPELKYTPSGTSVCQLRIAVDRAGMKEDDGTFGAGFFDVSVWGDQGERCNEWLSKGRQVGVTGDLRWREWETDNGKRQAVDITARWVTFLGKKDEGQGAQNDAPADADSDIPF